jgi:hypothetical protein
MRERKQVRVQGGRRRDHRSDSGGGRIKQSENKIVNPDPYPASSPAGSSNPECPTHLMLRRLSNSDRLLRWDSPQPLLLVRHLLLPSRRLLGGVELGFSLRHFKGEFD